MVTASQEKKSFINWAFLNAFFLAGEEEEMIWLEHVEEKVYYYIK